MPCQCEISSFEPTPVSHPRPSLNLAHYMQRKSLKFSRVHPFSVLNALEPPSAPMLTCEPLACVRAIISTHLYCRSRVSNPKNPNLLTLIVLVPAPRPRIAPNQCIRAHGPVSSDDNRYPTLTCMPCASEISSYEPARMLQSCETLTLTIKYASCTTTPH